MPSQTVCPISQERDKQILLSLQPLKALVNGIRINPRIKEIESELTKIHIPCMHSQTAYPISQERDKRILSSLRALKAVENGIKINPRIKEIDAELTKIHIPCALRLHAPYLKNGTTKSSHLFRPFKQY
jgi:hypothetical protein